jgi:hypothetical protein
MLLAVVIAAIFLINLVFGYWRANTRKFTWQWIAAIHVPVPMAIGLRLWLLGWNWALIPVFVLDFALGQFAGGRIRQAWDKKGDIKLSSWLIGDGLRVISSVREEKQSAPEIE